MKPDNDESSPRSVPGEKRSPATGEPTVTADRGPTQPGTSARSARIPDGAIASVYQQSPVAQAILDADLRLAEVNDEFARLASLDNQWLIGNGLSSALPDVYQALRAIDLKSFESHAVDVELHAPPDISETQPVRLIVRRFIDASSGQPFYGLTMLPRPDTSGMREQRVMDLRRERAARREAEISAEIVERILGITDVALAHIDLNDLLNELLGRIRDVLKTDEASILVIEPGDDSLSLRVSLGPDRLVRKPVRVRVGVGFAGRIAATKRPIVLEDITVFPFANTAMIDRGVRSLMGVPMMVDDRVLGVVHVGMMTPRQFDRAELHLLELAAARIALAVDRANLYQAERDARGVAERAQRRNEFLATASEILASSLNYRETLGRLARFVVPEVADLCTVTVIGQDEVVRMIASSGSSSELEAMVALQRRYFPRPLQDCPSVKSVAESGLSQLIDPFSPRFIEQESGGPEHFELLQHANLVSGMRVPLKSGGRAIGMISFWLSNTERRFKSEDLTLAEDLAHRAALATDNAWNYEEARKAIGARDEFISIASHELKTPLTTVKGYVQLLRRHINDVSADRERVNRTFSQLQDQVIRFEELVDELLDVSRIQGGRIPLNYEHCNLSYLVSQVVERVGQAFEQETPHKLVFFAPAPVWGHWDASRLDQVVTNLMSNAVKYSPVGSEIRVEVRGRDAEAEIVVTDDGIGISADDVNRVMQPFTRGVGASEIAPGAGLGLYIAHEIVRRHGGTLSIRSEPGHGSTFTVRLPREIHDGNRERNV